MLVSEDHVNSTGASLSDPAGSQYRTGPGFVFKTEPSVPVGVGPFHHLHNVIITPVASPTSSPTTVASPAASPMSLDTLSSLNTTSSVSATHPDLAKFSQTTVQLSSSGCVLQNSLPPPPLPSLGRVLTPRTDPTGCEENGITLLGNKYILLDQLEGSNLRRCIHVDSHDQFVCKVGVPNNTWEFTRLSREGGGDGKLAPPPHPDFNVVLCLTVFLVFGVA